MHYNDIYMAKQLKRYFSLILDTPFRGWAFIVYFFVQYVLPVFFVLPYIEDIFCKNGCSSDTQDDVFSWMILILMVLFGYALSAFPKKKSDIIKVYMPFVISTLYFFILYGARQFSHGLALYGAIILSAASISLCVTIILHIIKKSRIHVKHKKSQHIAQFWFGWILQLSIFSILVYILLQASFKVFRYAIDVQHMESLYVYSYIGVTYITMLYGTLTYLNNE